MKIESENFATDERVTELIKLMSAMISHHTNVPVSFILIWDNVDTLRVNVEKTLIPIIDTFQVYVTKGIMRYICDLLYIALSDNSIFQDVGKSSHIVKIPTLHVPDWGILDLAMQNIELPEFDDKRVKLHECLFSIAAEFVIFHEAIHILNGHSGYLYHRLNNIKNENPVDELSALDYQTLEYDADCIATAMFWEYLKSNKAKICGDLFKQDKELLDAFMITISLMFFGLPHQLLKTNEDLHNKQHLTSSIRHYFFMGTVFNILDKHPLEKGTFENVISKMFEDLKKLIDNKILPPEVVDDLIKAQSQEVLDHINKISDNWFTKWYNKLQPFTYIKLGK